MSEYIFVTNIFEYSNIRIYSSHSVLDLTVHISNEPNSWFPCFSLFVRSCGHSDHLILKFYIKIVNKTYSPKKPPQGSGRAQSCQYCRSLLATASLWQGFSCRPVVPVSGHPEMKYCPAQEGNDDPNLVVPVRA